MRSLGTSLICLALAMYATIAQAETIPPAELQAPRFMCLDYPLSGPAFMKGLVSGGKWERVDAGTFVYDVAPKDALTGKARESVSKDLASWYRGGSINRDDYITGQFDGMVSRLNVATYGQVQAVSSALKSMSDISGSVNTMFNIAALSKGTADIIKSLPDTAISLIGNIEKIPKDTQIIKSIANKIVSSIEATTNGDVNDRLAAAIDLYGAISTGAKDAATIKAANDVISMIDGAKKVGANMHEIASEVDKLTTVFIGVYQANAIASRDDKIIMQDMIVKEMAKVAGLSVTDFAKSNPKLKVFSEERSSFLGIETVKIVEVPIGQVYM